MQEERDIKEDFQHPELELMMQCSDWKDMYDLLNKDQRRVIRYYKCHRRGKCSFHINWLKGIESAIAYINDYCWQQINQRLTVYDQIDNRYWAGLGINQKPWSKTKAKALLFLEKDRQFLKTICDRSNKLVGHRRFLIVVVNAEKRLKYKRY